MKTSKQLKNRRSYWHRLKAKKGESLAETLISILVIALGLLLLASMVMASKSLINKSETVFKENYAEKNFVESGVASSEESSDTNSTSASESEPTEVKGTVSISGNLEDLTDVDDVPSVDDFSYGVNREITVNVFVTEKNRVFNYTTDENTTGQAQDDEEENAGKME